MGQGPRALSYIEPQTKVIRAMGQGPRAPSLSGAVLQRRDGFRLQERSDRPQGWPGEMARIEDASWGPFNGATKPESIPARRRHTPQYQRVIGSSLLLPFVIST